MAVDLTNIESKQGALDALKIILKSRKQPIKVQVGPGGGGGPQLQPPKNIEIEKGRGGKPPIPPEEPPQDPPGGNPPPDGPTGPKGPQPPNGPSGPGSNEDGDKGDGETPQERADRIARINDPTDIAADLADIQQDTALRNAEIARKNAKKNAVDDLVNGVSGGSLADFASFSADLFKAISTQVRQAKHKSDTYRRPNASYAGTDYLLPGKDYLDKKQVPVIGVYFDQSGSWGPDEIKKGIEAIACLHQFQKQKKLKIKLFFFANHLHDNPEDCKSEGGTRGFPEVLAHINNPANKIQNAIILTDSDVQGQTDWSKQPTVAIPGCVWYLWKYGSRSKSAVQHLKGARGTFQYELTV
jgi:hypothetical protein